MATKVRVPHAETLGAYESDGLANAKDFGLQIDAGHIFTVGKRQSVFSDDGAWCVSTGEIELRNGQRFWALLQICVQDQGEHYGTFVPYNGEVRGQEEGLEGFNC